MSSDTLKQFAGCDGIQFNLSMESTTNFLLSVETHSKTNRSLTMNHCMKIEFWFLFMFSSF